MLNCTWREFDYYITGYYRRTEKDWNQTRHMISSMYNSSGFSKKVVKPTDIIRLPSIDKPKRISVRKVSPDRLKQMLGILNN